MENIAQEVVLYETMFRRASGALVFKMLSTIKFEFKNQDGSFSTRLFFKNVSDNVKDYQEINIL